MNIGEWIAKRAWLYPGRPFLKEDGQELDNARFNARVNRTAHGLLDLGLAKGDRVVVLMANASAFLEVFFACAKTGALVVPVNTHLAAEELVHVVGDAAPRVLIYSADMEANVGKIKLDLGTGIRYLVHGQAASGDPTLEALTRDRWRMSLPQAMMWISPIP